MDIDLRNSLWNVIYPRLYERRSLLSTLTKVYVEFLKKPIDELPDYPGPAMLAFKKAYFDLEFQEVYDFPEFMVEIDRTPHQLGDKFNQVLERELSAYRFVGAHLSPISSETEIQAIEEALDGTRHLVGVNAHLEAALDKLTCRCPSYLAA